MSLTTTITFRSSLHYQNMNSSSGTRLVDLFPKAPSKVSQGVDIDDGGGSTEMDVEEDLFDALKQKLTSDDWAYRQVGGTSKSKTTEDTPEAGALTL